MARRLTPDRVRWRADHRLPHGRQLRVADGADLTAPPLARIAMPHVVPFDFHGNWLPEGAGTTLP